jgi:hypothetical protein
VKRVGRREVRMVCIDISDGHFIGGLRLQEKYTREGLKIFQISITIPVRNSVSRFRRDPKRYGFHCRSVLNP